MKQNEHKKKKTGKNGLTFFCIPYSVKETIVLRRNVHKGQGSDEIPYNALLYEKRDWNQEKEA